MPEPSIRKQCHDEAENRQADEGRTPAELGQQAADDNRADRLAEGEAGADDADGQTAATIHPTSGQTHDRHAVDGDRDNAQQAHDRHPQPERGRQHPNLVVAPRWDRLAGVAH